MCVLFHSICSVSWTKRLTKVHGVTMWLIRFNQIWYVGGKSTCERVKSFRSSPRFTYVFGLHDYNHTYHLFNSRWFKEGYVNDCKSYILYMTDFPLLIRLPIGLSIKWALSYSEEIYYNLQVGFYVEVLQSICGILCLQYFF